eukprot:3819641-Amphidinium_carterae.1
MSELFRLLTSSLNLNCQYSVPTNTRTIRRVRQAVRHEGLTSVVVAQESFQTARQNRRAHLKALHSK